ncbi:hypothetical protein F511_00310 [Dorcoceras hygrometricum]|nr:hypothetical protein F511_00310 [Dorcoceras hygrometricum]
MSVMLVTSVGEIVVDLFVDRCPLTCKNFIKLCKIKYYNGCLFHTVQKDFTAQTGDPTGTGSGGDSLYKFLYGDQARFFCDEIHLDVKHSKVGTVAMASAGENLNASQFYITLRDDLDYLDGKHTVFGEVAEGLDTLTRINEAYVDEKNKPYKNIRIKHTYILDDPFDDPPQLAELIPDASPEGKPKDEVDDDVRLEDDWIPLDEQLDAEQLEEMIRAKTAHSSAVVLETIGDIPEAEIKPPDNVLFVCKLNPVTEDEDLNTIFSRFGVVTSAEIIRDHKTGDSLCYAFIEFEDKEACEQAYFKMDNALIDDRRIHVDFSQSVAKLWAQSRHKGLMGGGGCYKCGSIDHIAKDCTGDSISGQENPKYLMKDADSQHGGEGNKRYEMVFEGDTDGSPMHSKRRRAHEPEKHGVKQDTKRRDRSEERREGSRYMRRSPDRRRQRDGPEQNDRNDGRKTDGSYHRNKRYDEKNKRRHDDGDDDRHKHKMEDRECEKKRGNDAAYGYKRDERKYEKRPEDDIGHGDGKNGNESKKKSAAEEIRGSGRVSRGISDENDGHKRRGEDRYSGSRSSRDDVRNRDRDHRARRH